MELKLPWLYKNSEFFVIKNFIQKSSIKDAGEGRFSNENINDNSLIRLTPVINVHDFTIKNMKGCIEINSYQELNNLKNFFKDNFKDNNIEKYMGWFSFTVGKRLMLYSHSFHINHSDESNVMPVIKEINNIEYVLEMTDKEIKKGQEFFWNYNSFSYPDFYLKWCRDNYIHTVKDIIN